MTHLQDSFLCTTTKEVPELDEIAWTANCLPGTWADKITIGFITYEDTTDLYIRERLIFSYIPIQVGSHSISSVDSNNPFCSYSRWLSDGDALNASWEIDIQKNNYIKVTKLDKKGIKEFNDEYILIGGSDKNEHVFPGRIAVFSAIFGLASAFGAFKTWRTLKRLRPIE